MIRPDYLLSVREFIADYEDPSELIKTLGSGERINDLLLDAAAQLLYELLFAVEGAATHLDLSNQPSSN